MLAKRFLPLSHFRESESSGYKLLPFRFTALDDRRYVLSNLVGDYMLATTDELQAIVHHGIPAGSDLYDQLRSKHFIYDADSAVAHELLGLKYRTKLSGLARFTALHMFVVTLRCDYSCQYCQVSRQTEDRSSYDMSAEIAKKSIDLTFQSPSPFIKIEFQGGEPLLNFELIKSIVCAAEERNAAERRQLQFVIASNLTHLSEEIFAFCADHEIYFSTSLDGPSDLHNSNRPRPGRNGYALTIDGIRQIQGRLGTTRVSALMTTTERSLSRVRDIVDEYVGNNLHDIFLRPISPYGFAIKTGQATRYDSDRWFAFYREGLEYILELNRHGYRLRETYAGIVLKKLLTPQNPGYVDLQSPAGLGISAIVYNYDGGVYASDEARMLAEMGDDTFRLGHILRDRYEDMLLSDRLLDALETTVTVSVPQCSDCAFLPYCGSDPVYHHATQGDVVGNKAVSGFCGRNMAVFRHLITLLEDSPKDREILLGWI
jgi:uncharacterized protein